MKMKKFLSMLIAVLLVLATVMSTAVTSLAFNEPNDIKEVGLTVAAPVAGRYADRSIDSVECADSMDYKVTGINWYKDDLNCRLGVDGNEAYFIGGHDYILEVYLETKGGRTWNYKASGYTFDYSYITAKVNGQSATVSAHPIHTENRKQICVTYRFEDLPKGAITNPSVIFPTPIAGNTYPSFNSSEIKLLTSNPAAINSDEYGWYVYDGVGNDCGSGYTRLTPNDHFIAGKSYRVKFMLTAKDGFRFPVENATDIGESKYLPCYVNGDLMRMELVKYAGQYQDNYATVIYDFDPCKATEIDEVEFSGITAPVAGQHPLYAVTIEDSTYSLVTDDAVSGGAEYGFVNGLAWKLGYGTPLTAQSTFEQGAYYTLSFFIRSDDIHCFADFVTGSANVGYVEVVPMFDDPTLAFVTVDFAPCGGGVMNEINISGVREPINGENPDYDFIYGQGYDEGLTPIWFDLTDNKALTPNDKFVYGHRYDLMIVIGSDKAFDTQNGKFEFAPHASLTVNINGVKADSFGVYDNRAENLWLQCSRSFDCGRAALSEVAVEVATPVERSNPADKVLIQSEYYGVETFSFFDPDEQKNLLLTDTFVAGKTYIFTILLSAKDGYEFGADNLNAIINGVPTTNITYSPDRSMVLIGTSFIADNLPYYTVSFDANGGSGGPMYPITAIAGETIDIPVCEYTAPEEMQFLAWSTDGTITGAVGDAEKLTVNEGYTLYALWEPTNSHTHVYGDTFNYHDDYEHAKTCISPNCPDFGDWTTRTEIFGHHYDMNFQFCDATCEDCGYVRSTNNDGSPLHVYAFPCSEVCWGCGFARQTTHTPGAEATCTDAQTCTVCSKVLAEAKGHTPGEAANCSHAQICTVCSAELAPIQGEHVPGAAANCTTPQTCTVCSAELAPATGHTAGAEWITDKNGHHRICAVCNGNIDEGEHTDGDGDKLCDTCGEKFGGLGAGAIVAIVIGSVAVAGIGGFAIFWFVIKKKSFADLKAVFKKK